MTIILFGMFVVMLVLGGSWSWWWLLGVFSGLLCGVAFTLEAVRNGWIKVPK